LDKIQCDYHVAKVNSSVRFLNSGLGGTIHNGRDRNAVNAADLIDGLVSRMMATFRSSF